MSISSWRWPSISWTLSKRCPSFQSQPNSPTLVHSKWSFESQTRTLYGYKPLRLLSFSITSEVCSLFHRPPAYHDVCHSDSPSPSARVLPHLRKISTLNAQNIDYACHLLCAEFVWLARCWSRSTSEYFICVLIAMEPHVNHTNWSPYQPKDSKNPRAPHTNAFTI